MRIVGKFIMLGLLLGLAACSDWLNVSRMIKLNEETLFTDGDGYRNALNGIYKDLQISHCMDRELTWGMNEVLGQTYHLNYIPSDHAYYYIWLGRCMIMIKLKQFCRPCGNRLIMRLQIVII